MLSNRLLKPVLLVGIFISLLTACQYYKSAVFSNVDSLILIKLDQYFDLTEEQTEYLKPKLTTHLQWAQENVVPALIIELEGLNNQQEPINPEQFNQLQQKVYAIWFNLIDQLADDAAWLFLKLSPKQLEYLKTELLEGHKERYEPVFCKQTEFAYKFAEFQESKLQVYSALVGDISELQRNDIIQLSQENKDSLKKDSTIIIKNRKQFFQKTLAFTDQNELADFFRLWTKKPTPEYETFRQQRKEKILATLASLENSLTNKQKEFRRAKISDYISDLKLLSKIKF